MKKILYVCLLVFSMLLVFVGCRTTAPTKIKVNLNEVTHSVFYAPQYVALNKGFFAEEGLDVNITVGQGADKVMTAVLSNQADIGLAGPEASIYVYNQGKEDYSVVFAQLTKRDGSFLVGKKPQPSFSFDNLKGSTIIGGRKGGVPEMTLEYVLRQKGLHIGTDVNVDTSVQFALMAGAFTGGNAEYVTLFEPTASMVEQQRKGYILTSIGQESGEIPYTAYFAKKSYIEKNKDVVQKFTNAIYKGQVWVDTHTPKEVAEAVKTSFPDTDLALLTTVAKRYKDIDAWNKTPVLEEKSLDLLQKVISEAGQLDKKAPYDKIVDTSFAKKAIKDAK